jgi:branched-chain amino acid transport system substrate-binding protein
MRQQMKRKKSYWAASVVLVLLGTAITHTPAYAVDPEPTVKSLTTGCSKLPLATAKVGVLVPLGAAFASDTQQVVDAAGIAISKLNAAGGVCGKTKRYKLQIVKGNTQGMESSAVIAAANLLNTTKDLNFVMTSYASQSNFEIDLMAKNKMPYLMSANSQQTAAIISKNPSKYPTIWSRVPSYTGYETELPRVLNGLETEGKIKFVNGKTVYIIAATDPYGQTIAEGLKKSFPANGWKVIGYDEIPPAGTTNWQANLTKIKLDVPDIIVNTNSTASDGAAFANQFAASPTNSLVFLQYSPSVPEFRDLAKDNANGIIYNMLGGAIPTLASTKEITAEFSAKFGTPGYFAVVAYDQLMIYANCIKKTGDPTNRLAIGKCLGNSNLKTAAGVLKFDQKTHLALQSDDTYPILFSQIQDGKLNVFFPSKYASGNTFQKPKWMK